SRMIALVFVNAALSCAVLISELPAALPRTPSKMLGVLRPCAEGCDCTIVEATTAPTNIPPTSASRARRAIVIDRLPPLRVVGSLRHFILATISVAASIRDDAEIEPARLR